MYALILEGVDLKELVKLRLFVFMAWLAILALIQLVSVVGGTQVSVAAIAAFMTLIAMLMWAMEKPNWAAMWAFTSTLTTIWIYS